MRQGARHGGRWHRAGLVVAAVMVAGVLGATGVVHARDAGEVTLTVRNPGNADAQLFMEDRKGHKTARGMVRAHDEVQLEVFVGQRLVAFYACSRKEPRFRVDNDIKVLWVLPRKPCR